MKKLSRITALLLSICISGSAATGTVTTKIILRMLPDRRMQNTLTEEFQQSIPDPE